MMRYIFILSLLLNVFNGFAGYDPTKTSYPYEYYEVGPYDWKSIANNRDWDFMSTHNAQSGTIGQYYNIAIFDDGYDASCYKFYAEVFYEAVRKHPVTGAILSGSFAQHSIGTINLNQLDPCGLGNTCNSSPNWSKIEFKKIENGKNVHALTIFFDDFPFTDPEEAHKYSFRVVVVRDGGGSCGDEQIGELFYSGNGGWEFAGEDTIDFRTPPAGLDIVVPDYTVCQGIAGLISGNASVTGSSSYTVAWAAETGSSMPADFNISSSDGTNKINDSFTINPALCSAGIYKIRATVTDNTDNSLTADTVFTVKVNPEVQVAIVTDESGTGGVCAGVPVHLTAQPTPAGAVYEYTWTTGNAPLDIDMSTPSLDSASVTGTLANGNTTYTVVVRDTATGCSVTADTLIIQKAAPYLELRMNTLAALNIEVCEGDKVDLTVTSNQAGTTFQWVVPAGGGTSATVTDYPTVSTTYEVTGTYNGCSTTVNNKSVAVNTKPVITLVQNPDSVCAVSLGGQGTVDLTTAQVNSTVALNTTATQFQPVGGGTPVTNAQLSAGTSDNFWLIGETAKGCKDTVTVTAKVNDLPAAPSITGGAEVCDGSSVQLDVTAPVAGSSYEWFEGSASLGTGTSLSSFIPASATQVTVEVTDANGCKNSSAQHHISINNLPVIASIVATPGTGCAGDELALQANITPGSAGTPYHNFVWTGVSSVEADSTQAKLTLAAGNNNYSLKVTDSKGCTAVQKTESSFGHSVTVNLAASTATIGQPVTLTANATQDGTAALTGGTVYWEFSQVSPAPGIECASNNASRTCSPVITALTTYKVVVTDQATGCQAEDTLTPPVTAPPLVVSSQNVTLCYGETDFTDVGFVQVINGGVPPYTFTWNIPGSAAAWLKTNDRGDTLFITGITDWASALTASPLNVGCEVKDANGTLRSAPVTLTVLRQTKLAINSKEDGDSLRICQNTGAYTLTLTGKNGVSAESLHAVNWLTPAGITATGTTLNIPTNLADAGTMYKVTAVDSKGCPTDTVEVKMIIDALPNPGNLTAMAGAVSVMDGWVCPNTTVDIAVTGTTGVDPITMAWSNGVTANTTSWVPSTTDSLFVLTVNDKYCSAKDTVKIRTYTPEVLVLSGDESVCETASALTLTSTGLTSGGLTQYVWSSVPADAAIVANATSQNVAPTETTVYYVDGTDVHGCTVARDSIVVKVDTMPVFVLAQHTLAACQVNLYDAVGSVGTGSTLKYGTSAGFTPGTNLTDPTPVTTGKYYVRAENGECVTPEDTVRVMILSTPQLAVSSSLSGCAPDSIDLASGIDWNNTTFDPTNITYWSDAAATANQLTSSKVCPAASTTYYIKGSSHGCNDQIGAVTVTIHPKPVLELSVADTAVCAPSMGDLSRAVKAAAGSASITQYLYYSDAAYSTAIPSAVAVSGTYYVIGQTANNCSDSIEVTMSIKPQPVFTVATPAAVCEPGTVDLTTLPGTVTGVSYTYYKDQACTDELTGANLTVSDSAMYYVVGTHSQTACTDTVGVNVEINKLPVLTITGDTIYCYPGMNVDLTVLGADTYNWYDVPAATVQYSASHVSWTPSGAGNYSFSVEGTSIHSCKDSATVNVHIIESPKVSVTGATEVCNNETIRVTADTTGLTTGPFTYAWTNATATTGNEATATLSSATKVVEYDTIHVQVTDRYGCTGPDSTLIVKINAFQPALVASVGGVDLGTGDMVTPGTTVVLTAAPTGTYEYKFLKVKTPADSLMQDWGNANTVNAVVVGTTNYKVLVRNTVTNCVDSVILNVPVDGEPLDWATTSGTDICFSADPTGKTMEAQPKGGRTPYTYEWVVPDSRIVLSWTTTPINTASQASVTSIGNLPAGAYPVKVRVTDANGNKDSIDVTLTINALPNVTLTQTTLDSCGTFVDLTKAYTADAGNTYTYLKVSDGSIVSNVVTADGDYKVIATATATACQDTSVAITAAIHPIPTVNLLKDAVYCVGDTTTIQAVAAGGTAPYTYTWSNNASPVVTDNSYAKVELAGAATIVTVEVQDSYGCEVTSAPYSLTGETVTAALSCAPTSPVAAGTPVIWTASPSTGMENYQFIRTTPAPETVMPLTSKDTISEIVSEETCYKVIVISEHGCRDTLETPVCVTVDPGSLAKVVALGDSLCSGVEQAVLTSSILPAGSAVSDYKWIPLGGASALTVVGADNLDSLVVDIRSAAVNTLYQFEISINGGAAKDTADLMIYPGVEITSLVALDSCSRQVTFEVTATGATDDYEWRALTMNVMGGCGVGNCNRWIAALDPGTTTYTVTVRASNAHCEDRDTLSGRIYDLGLNLAFAGNDTCGTNVQLPLNYSVNGGYGNVIARYTYQSFTGGAGIQDSVLITPPSAAAVTASAPGVYVLTNIYATAAPACSLTVNDTLKVGDLPEVDLVENCLALHKDTTFNLNIANTGDFNYIWNVSESSDGLTWTAGGPADGTLTSNINGQMEDKDLQYVITATSKNLDKCKVSDTAHIYRIPDAPLTDIDTINDKRHIQLKWSASAFADNYTVWSRKWDPYCLTGKDGNTYTAEATVLTQSWAEPVMDSLEFYYLTANRRICSTEYKSFATDTFGYARHIADGTTAINPDAAMQNRANFAFQYAFPYIFDMSRYGVDSLTDLGDYISDHKVKRPLKAIALWERDNYYQPGLWGWVAQNYTPMFGGQWGKRGTPPLSEKLIIGQCIMVDIYVDSIQEIVILGRLNDAVNVNFDIKNVVANTSHNLFYIPFRNILQDEAIKIAPAGSSLKASLVAMGFWVFDYNNLRTVNSVTMFGQDKFSADGNPSSAPYAFKKRAGYDVLSFDAGITSGNVNIVWP